VRECACRTRANTSGGRSCEEFLLGFAFMFVTSLATAPGLPSNMDYEPTDVATANNFR
jgi:hypothetical protein